MKKINVLLVAFTRTEKLIETINAVRANFNIGKIYCYVDKFYNVETRNHQKELLKFLATQKDIIVRKTKENQGCSLAMVSAIKWVFENESEVLVLEEDILVTTESADFFSENIENCDPNTPFIIRFGQYFWGFYLNEKAFFQIESMDLDLVTKEVFKEMNETFQIAKHWNHFRMIIHEWKNSPWDAMWHVKLYLLSILQFIPNVPTTVHNGADESARIPQELATGKVYKSVVMIDGVIQ